MPPSATLVASLLLFAAATAGLPVPASRAPVVRLATPAEEADLATIEASGMTDPRTGRIVLRRGWRPNVAGKCALAHELTHYLQWTAGIYTPRSTGAEVEPAAYYVQARCLLYYGRRREAAERFAAAEKFRRQGE